MGKHGIFEFVNLQSKTQTLKDGRDYEMVIAVSDDSNKINPNSEVGKKLRTLGFMLHPEGYFFKFKKHLKAEDLDALNALNGDLKNNGVTPENLSEYIKVDKITDEKKDGSDYETWVASSDTPGELTRDSEAGRFLKGRRFFWHAKQRYQKSPEQFTQNDLDAIKKYNDYLESLGGQRGLKQDIIDFLEGIRDKISGTDINVKTEQELKATIGTFISKLADATEQEAEKMFQKIITATARFHTYSDENKILIYLQKPDATHVASMRRWKEKFKRRVVKRDEAITINCGNNWYYNTNKPGNPEEEYTLDQQEKDEDYQQAVSMGAISRNPEWDDDIKMRQIQSREPTFAPCFVFDISATEGRPLSAAPQRGSWTTTVNTNNDNSEIANRVFEIAKQSLEANGIQVTQNPATAGEAGWSRRGQINVSSDVTGTYAVSTIIKEWAGDLLHQEGGKFYDNTLDYFEQKGELEPQQIHQIEKVQEATVAAAICNHLGLPTDEHPTYMANLRTQGGLDSAQLIRENLNTLTKVSNYILKELRKHGRELDSIAGVGQQQQQVAR